MSAIGTSADASIAWAKTCERLRAKVSDASGGALGFAKNAGLFLFPSLESALLELSLLLTERERELGGSKSIVAYGHLQDPALDLMAKTLSSVGLDIQPKSSAEMRNPAAWFAESKSKLLLGAWAEDDRFTGEVHPYGIDEASELRSLFFTDGVRIPVLVLNSGSHDWRASIPRPYEVRVHEVALGSGESAVVALAGERLRLEPRLAPYGMSRASLRRAEEVLSAAVGISNRETIEKFEASLPKPLTAWWPVGASRRWDRAIFGSSEHDGSWLIDQLRGPVTKSLVAKGLTEAEALQKFQDGVFSLSGCLMHDERRQEWLRSRGDDAWKIRGAVHVSLALLSDLAHDDLVRMIPT